jgi:penicillin-binding protein 1A
MAMDPSSGKIRVWIGGNHFRYLPYDLVTSVHPSASAFKPIMYATALELGMEPCEYLNNEEYTFEEYDDWTPANYDGTSGGEVSMWYALVKSLNLPSVDLFFRLNYKELEEVCENLELDELPEDAPSVSLGTLGTSLYQMTRVYASFANGGYLVEPTLVEKITDNEGRVIYEAVASQKTKVWEPETVQLLTEMLELAVNNGTGVSFRSRFGINAEFAGKTGTSQNYQDAWFIGYTPELVCGTWVGTRDPRVHFSNGYNGSGSALALPVVAGMMGAIEQHRYLRADYLSSFGFETRLLDTLDCPGIKEELTIRSIWEEIFGPSRREKRDTLEVEKEKALRDLFRRIFKRKEKEPDKVDEPDDFVE